MRQHLVAVLVRLPVAEDAVVLRHVGALRHELAVRDAALRLLAPLPANQRRVLL